MALAFTGGFITLWHSMNRKQEKLSEKPAETRINISKLGTGIFLFEKFIVVKSESLLKVYSNKCTHAGCRINQEIDGQLLCPCHGSKFDAATGRVLQGPAGLPLSAIPFITNVKTGEIIIKV